MASRAMTRNLAAMLIQNGGCLERAMAKAAWTPGPWRAGVDVNDQPFVKGGGIYEEINREEDAHLIAAAPDLYDALAEMARLSVGGAATDEQLNTAEANARTALAKARGETHG